MRRQSRPHPCSPITPAVLAAVEISGLLGLQDLAAGKPADELLAQALVSLELARMGVGDDTVVAQAETALAVLAGDDAGAEVAVLTTMMVTLLAQLRVCNHRQLDRAQDAALQALAATPAPRP